MANPKHIKWLLDGVESWNARREQEDFEPDFADANIYEEFHKAGKINSDGHIPLSRINLSRASFLESRLSSRFTTGGAVFRHANLRFANLQNSQLANSRLDGAVLCGANLTGANLSSASLCGAKMSSARLHGTELFQADLTDAKLGLAYCVNANLSSATLVGTDLATANLTGTDLGWSRPWEAKLYQDSDSSSRAYTNAGYDKRINCIADLIKKCFDLRAHHADDVLYFRGEHTNTWELRPSVMRSSQGDVVSLRVRESDMLLELMSRRPEDFNDTTSALAQWVLAQHHGLKTRLLDVTRNPLVALFAACESDRNTGRVHVFSVPRELVKPFNSDTISIIANFSKLSRDEQYLLLGWTGDDIEEREPDSQFQYIYENAMRRLYHLIRQEKPHFKERIDPRDLFRVFVVEPQQLFERIRAQSGAFLISAFHERLERSEVLHWNPGIPIYDHYTLEVPKKKKQRILNELRLLNITRETLYPGLDEAAKAVTQRHLALIVHKGNPGLFKFNADIPR